MTCTAISMADTRAAALVAAAAAGNIDSLGALLASGVDPDSMDAQGEVALAAAASAGHGDAVQTLLAAGASATHQGQGGCTPLAAAAMAGHEHVARLLLDSCPWHALECLLDNVRTDAGYNVLTVACLHNQPGMLAILLDELARDMAAPDMATAMEERVSQLLARLLERPVPVPMGRPVRVGWLGHCLYEALLAAVAAGSLECQQLLCEEALLQQHYQEVYAAGRDPAAASMTWSAVTENLGFLLDPGIVGPHLEAFSFLTCFGKARGCRCLTSA